MDEKYIKITQEWYSRGYEAGAQSRQAEIEEITETLKTSADSEKYLFDELQKVKKERDELQKRLKKAEKLMSLFFEEDSFEYAVLAHDELKGNKND